MDTWVAFGNMNLDFKLIDLKYFDFKYKDFKP